MRGTNQCDLAGTRHGYRQGIGAGNSSPRVLHGMQEDRATIWGARVPPMPSPYSEEFAGSRFWRKIDRGMRGLLPCVCVTHAPCGVTRSSRSYLRQVRVLVCNPPSRRGGCGAPRYHRPCRIHRMQNESPS